MRHMTVLVLCFLFTASVAIGWAEEKEAPIKIISGRPRNISPSSNITIGVMIQKTPENRKIGIECDSEEMYQKSEKSLDGDNSPAVFYFGFNLAPGNYECIATLTRNVEGKEKKYTAKNNFKVIY